MDDRLAVAPIVGEFAARVREWLVLEALYVGGSLATGDYRPEVSDLDVVAIIPKPLGADDRRRLKRHHRDLERQFPSAARLHCLYADTQALANADTEHPMWSERRLTGRRLSEMTRVELVRNGITIHGPPPSASFRDWGSAAALRRAVHTELVGYWQRAVDRPSLWLSDWCVDLGLVTVARADAAIREDRLITKREAIDRLDLYGVPEALQREIRQRREGVSGRRSSVGRVRRGRTARRLVARAIEDLTAPALSKVVE